MQCNIDHRGRRVRMIWGLGMLVIASCLAVAGALGLIGPSWAWGGGIGAVLLGVFGIYESRKGWCAMRAMGFRTPV